MKKYDLTDEEKFMLEEVLSWAQTIVDVQVDAECQTEMQNILTDLADVMGIEYTEVRIEETTDDDGSTLVRLVAKNSDTKKPHLTLVTDDNELK